VALSGLDPDAALDELEPLADAIGDARVVAIGESAHFVREFTLARERITRFLAERCGFTVFAFEFGFSEAFAVDRWVQGAGAVEDLAQVSETASAWGAGDLLGFLRRHNATSDHRLRFVGVDIPEAGGSLLPALDPVADFLRDVDLEAVPDLERAIAIAGRFASGSGASAAPAWAQLQASEQDALTATLARLLRRFHALEPVYVARSDQQAYEIALHRLRAAGHADGMFPAMAALFAGTGVPGELSVRDYYMAETVRWHLDHADRAGLPQQPHPENRGRLQRPVHQSADGSIPRSGPRRRLLRGRTHDHGRSCPGDATRRALADRVQNRRCTHGAAVTGECRGGGPRRGRLSRSGRSAPCADGARPAGLGVEDPHTELVHGSARPGRI
jgi:hypothetical protein